MDHNFVYLNAFTIMLDITQKLHSGILLYCQSKSHKSNSTSIKLLKPFHQKTNKSKEKNFFLAKFLFDITNNTAPSSTYCKCPLSPKYQKPIEFQRAFE